MASLFFPFVAIGIGGMDTPGASSDDGAPFHAMDDVLLFSQFLKRFGCLVPKQTVTKYSPVMVHPSEMERSTPPLPASDTVALSSFDSDTLPFPVTALLVFDRRIDKPVETIKGALSRALAYYRPIAGRLDGDGSGIVCTGEGVVFVAASVSCALEDAIMDVLPQMDLAVRYPGLLCGDGEPLLLVQVIEFLCGGFTVGVTWNHVLADAAGMAQLLQAIGEFAREVSQPPSVLPIRSWEDSSVIPSLSSSNLATMKSMIEHEPQPMACLNIVVPYGLISRIKAGEFGGCNGEPCTVFEAVAAVLWRSHTRAALSASDPESPAPLTFTCNVRAHVRAPVGYYGNCVAIPVVPATVGVVANSDIGEIVALIRRAKEKILDLLSTRSGDGGGSLVAADQGRPPLWYETLAMTSWRNLGLDVMDFGGGAPARVLSHAERAMVPGFVVCPPRRRAGRDDGVGVDVSGMFVKQEHVDAFLGELARLSASADISSPANNTAD